MKIITPLIFVILMTSLVSAEIIINQQPKNSYNMGEIINIPIKITSPTTISKFLTMYLLCNGHQTEIHKQYISLKSGEEIQVNPTIPLIQSFTKKTSGKCKIKAVLGEQYSLSNEFEVLDLIIVELKDKTTKISPEKEIIAEGSAIKANGESAEGFVELKITSEDLIENIELLDTVKNGYFIMNFTLPKGTKAGQYLVRVDVYEKDAEGNITNKGFVNYNLQVNQVPTSLEIVFETSEVEPGTNMKVKAVLHDQTGEKIESKAIVSIKDGKDKILEQTEFNTDEFFEYPIKYNEPPAEWTVFAVSNRLSAESTFLIIEKQDVKIELINKTLTLTNIGNVPYNKTILVKIGDESLNINTLLEVDETKKYVITAPDGEYQIDVITDGESRITGMASLTGNDINIKEVSGGVISVIKHPISWLFMFLILGFVAFMIVRKGYKRSFFGRMNFKKDEKVVPLVKDSFIKTSSKAEVALSIKGEKQNTSIVCLKVKNLGEIQSEKSNAEEILQKIVNMAEENKASTYENIDNLFFILAPLKTKTFSNEKTALKIAQQAEKIITEHNKLAKQKIEFGISVNYGAIIAKQEKESLKFMSMGNTINMAKKIASLADKEILLSEDVTDKIRTQAKVEKLKKGNITFYKIKELKPDNKESKTFISNFIKRLEGGEKDN